MLHFPILGWAGKGWTLTGWLWYSYRPTPIIGVIRMSDNGNSFCGVTVVEREAESTPILMVRRLSGNNLAWNILSSLPRINESGKEGTKHNQEDQYNKWSECFK